MGKLRDNAHEVLRRRVRRICRLMANGAPDSLVAAEAELIGDAGRLLDPAGHVERQTSYAIMEARTTFGLCRHPECDVEVGHGADRMCQEHASELSAMLAGESGGSNPS